MGRPLTGKTHVGIRRETRSNGDVYVYERVTGYDPKTQKTKTLSTRLLGKILAGSTEMIPTRPKKKRSEVIEAPVQAVRTHVGLQKILEWAGHESGIDADLQRSFEIGDALKLSSIARYWVATDGDTLPRMESWQVMNPLPYGHPITQDVYGKLFASVGRNESGVQSYFQCRGQRVLSTGLNLALDTTTFSTYSKNSPTVPTSGFARKSTPHAKSSGTSGTSARLTSMSAASCAAGSTGSASCENARAGISKPGRRNRLRDACTSMYFTNRRLLRFRSAGFARAFSHSRRIWRTASRNFRPAAQKQIDSYLTVKRTAKGVKVDFKMDEIEEAKRYWGYFVLVSNEIKDPFDALKAYRSREKIEELFATYKDSFDGRKPRTWYPENLYGRQFAQFVGLGYHCFLAKRILDVKKALSEKETEGKTKEELSLEAKLLAWLNQHSLIQILDWFRCVDYVAATGNASASKWTTETTRRDQLFLKMLGVK